MAILTNDDFTDIRRYQRGDPVAHEVIKAWGINKATWKALYQASEDWFVDGLDTTPTESLKSALNTELPVPLQPITNGQAKQISRIWAKWRVKADPA